MKVFSSLMVGALMALSSTSLAAQNYYNPANPGPATYTNPQQPQGPSYTQAGRINWLTNFQAAQQQSRQAGKPILVFFTGTGWCTWCIKLEKEVLENPEFAQAVGNQFIFVKADFPDYTEEAIMRSPYRSIMERYNIEAFPTLIAIDPNGQQLFTMGYQAGGARNYAQQLMNKLNSANANRGSFR